MKLSEAIRKGQSLVGSTQNVFWYKDPNEKYYCCPIATAIVGQCGVEKLESIGYAVDNVTFESALPECDIEYTDGVVVSPVDSDCYAHLLDTIYYLTDEAGWSRKQVLEWLEDIGE